MQKHFDVFIQPKLDKMRVQLSGSGNPASLADDIELLEEYHKRYKESEAFRVTSESYSDYLTGRSTMLEAYDAVPF